MFLPLLFACSAEMEATATETDTLQLKAWSVPVGSEERVESMLNRLFYRGDATTSRTRP
jgi:hypothetical protein